MKDLNPAHASPAGSTSSVQDFKRKASQIALNQRVTQEFAELLSDDALAFLSELERKFGKTRKLLLESRRENQERIDRGEFPDFLKETREIRESDWKVAPIPQDILDRRVEITGPVERKMVINALNSGAKVFMADFEDSHSPTWLGTLQGQKNLMEAVRGTIRYSSPEGKEYSLNPTTAVLFVRPRGWHLEEKYAILDQCPVSASLFDFGLYFFHNAKELIRQGKRPYFYLPKMESHLEARLWNEVFRYAQEYLGIPQGTIRATVLIETLPAVFEMDEILFELKDHSAGLNCGRWDYIFSFIKKFRRHSRFVLPDRAKVTMDVPFLKSYCQLLIQTCHRRGIHAMGGMAAQIPIKSDPEANEVAMNKVIQDKKREVALGHDGTWVAHPGLVSIAQQVFDAEMPGPNQIDRTSPPSEPVSVTRDDLIAAPPGEVTEAGLRTNINVAVLYLESWLRGVGCVPLYNLMEDAATAEISRAQIWQWLTHGKVKLSEFQSVFEEEKVRIRSLVGEERYLSGKFSLAEKLLAEIVTSNEFAEFITLPAYSYL